MGKPELLPCPWLDCGSPHVGLEYHVGFSGGRWFVDCRSCGASGPRKRSPDSAREAWNRRTASPVAPEGAAPTPPSEAVTPGQRPAPYHDTGTCDVCDGRRSGKPPFGDGTPGEPPRCDRCPHPPHVGACHGRLGHTAYQCVCIYDTVPSASATTVGPRGECYENARDIQRREQDERPGLTAEEVTALQVGCGTGRTEGTRGDGPGAPKADQDKLKTELEAARSLLNEWCATPDREATLRPQGADGSYGASLWGRTIARLYDIDKALAGTGRTDDPQGETPSEPPSTFVHGLPGFASATTEGTQGETPSRAEKPGGTR